MRRITGEYYWVKCGRTWRVAMYHPRACNGWTNNDTCEDFNYECKEYIHIRKPDQLMKLIAKKGFDSLPKV